MSESITKVGVVTDITSESKPRKDGKGSFTVHNILVDGKRYGLGFKNDLVVNSGVQKGHTVKITVVKNGDFWNVDSLEKVEAQIPDAVQATVVATTGAETPTRTYGVQVQIVRQSALKIAADMVIGFGTFHNRKAAVPLDQMLGKIVAFADHLVQYVETGKVDLSNVNDAKKLAEEGVEVSE